MPPDTLGQTILKANYDMGTSINDVPGFLAIFDLPTLSYSTPPNSEIICGQNVGTKVVCGIIFFFEKKAMLKI